MKPLRVSARNYRRFRELELDLPDGCVAVIGPNGAGKSSLVDLIDVALFADGGRELAQWVTAGELEMEIGLEFEHSGTVYRVRRTYSAGGRGRTWLDFERHVFSGANGPSDAPGGWDSLNRETTSATQAAIADTLRLTRSTFRASAFSGQGDSAAFADAQPRDRKAMLAEILSLDLWPRLAELARADAAAAVAELAGIQAGIAARADVAELRPEITAKLAAIAEAEATARDALAHALADLEAAQAQRAAADGATSRVTACEAEKRRADADLAAAQAALDDARAADAQLPSKREALAAAEAAVQTERELEQELTEALAESEARRDLDRVEADCRRLNDEIDQLAARWTSLGERADVIRQEEHPDCDRCGQPLDQAGRERALVSITEEQAEASERREQWQVRLAELDTAVREGRARLDAVAGARPEPEIRADLDRTRATVELRHLLQAELQAREDKAGQAPALAQRVETAQAAADTAASSLDAAQRDLPDIPALDRAVHDARVVHEARRSDHEQLVRQHAAAETELAAVERAEHELAQLRQHAARLEDDVDLYRLAERAYGRDGIPALILENSALPQIETEANDMLADLPTRDGRVYRIELRTQRALKSRDGVAEALDIVVIDELGERMLETFSGGERARLSIALRLGLARLLANRRGAELRLLVLDEPDGLEEDAMLQLAGLLRVHEGEFGLIAVISHHPALREAFDRRIELVCDGGVSRVVSEAAASVSVAGGLATVAS